MNHHFWASNISYLRYCSWSNWFC